MAADDELPLVTLAERALASMARRGFEHAQVDVSRRRHTELNLAHNEPSLLRSGHSHQLGLLGLLDGRRAATELADLSAQALDDAVSALWLAVQSAPQDEANAVSSGQRADIRQGPLLRDPDHPDHCGDGAATLSPEDAADTAAAAMAELRNWRAEHAPTVMIEEAYAAHVQCNGHTLTSGGSSLASALAWYELHVMATAHERGRTSSFNYTGGSCDGLAGRPLVEHCGIAGMLGELTRQVNTEPLAEKFVGELVLGPPAVAALVEWLLVQLADQALIGDSSLYRQRVGEQVASPLLSLASRFNAPGVAALSADAFAAPPVMLLQAGRLRTLTPSLYGSRKTGLPHVPLAASGWAIEAGATPLEDLVAAVPRGALVGRLSMGRPAANGDFSGVIKNSFLIDQGCRGPALREVMVSGNVAEMLQSVRGVSAERIDTGHWLLPWLHIDGLHFS